MMSKNNNKSTNDIFIIGVGMTPVGEHWDRSLRELALEAMTAARDETGAMRPEAVYVANMLAPALSRQSHLGALLADFSGMRGIEAVAIEAAGASGGMALRQAYLALASGMVNTALVVGVEKITERVTAEVEAALISSSDADYESIHGVTQTALAAMLMRRYIYEYNVPEHAFAGFSITAHANGAKNPKAMFRRPIKLETYKRAAMVSDPINMFDAAPIADGAAAIFLARGDVLPSNLPFPPVRIEASAAAISAVAVHDRPNPLSFSAAENSARVVLDRAEINIDQIDFFEVHDRFSIFAALSLEAAGFAAPGEGWKLAESGAIALDGQIPICTYGGSKARGDTGGATGVYQAVEAALQLQGRAGEIQVAEARLGLIQSLGGTGSTATSHILSAVETL
ncbi:MAG: thiolase domain-containing protein [Anaerolineales bacterium]|nr:thiolase domain-containing protein [Anaerolineales bacterium]